MTADMTRTLALLDAAWSHTRLGDFAAVRRLLDDLPEDELLRDPELACLLAEACRSTGEVARARALLADVRASTPWHGNDSGYRMLLNNEGLVHLMDGDLAAAEQSWLELVHLATEAGDHRRVGRACCNLGVVANIRRQDADALALFARGRVASLRADDRAIVAAAHLNASISYLELGRLDDALAASDETLALARLEHEGLLVPAESGRALLYLARGDVRMAEAILVRALRRESQARRGVALDDLEMAYGRVLVLLGQVDEGLRLLRGVTERAEEAGGILALAYARTELAVGLAQAGDRAGALAEAGQVCEAWYAMGVPARVDWVSARLREAAALHDAGS